MIKKDWFSDFKILEIHQQVNWKTCQQDSDIRIGMVNAEKWDHSYWIEMASNCNESNTHPNIEQTLTQEKINLETIKRMMSEKKTTLPSFRNQDWKTVKAEIEKKWIINTYLNEWHHKIKWTKLVCKKIRFPLKNMNKNSKSRWKIRLRKPWQKC